MKKLILLFITLVASGTFVMASPADSLSDIQTKCLYAAAKWLRTEAPENPKTVSFQNISWFYTYPGTEYKRIEDSLRYTDELLQMLSMTEDSRIETDSLEQEIEMIRQILKSRPDSIETIEFEAIFDMKCKDTSYVSIRYAFRLTPSYTVEEAWRSDQFLSGLFDDPLFNFLHQKKFADPITFEPPAPPPAPKPLIDMSNIHNKAIVFGILIAVIAAVYIVYAKFLKGK